MSQFLDEPEIKNFDTNPAPFLVSYGDMNGVVAWSNSNIVWYTPNQGIGAGQNTGAVMSPALIHIPRGPEKSEHIGSIIYLLKIQFSISVNINSDIQQYGFINPFQRIIDNNLTHVLNYPQQNNIITQNPNALPPLAYNMTTTIPAYTVNGTITGTSTTRIPNPIQYDLLSTYNYIKSASLRILLVLDKQSNGSTCGDLPFLNASFISSPLISSILKPTLINPNIPLSSPFLNSFIDDTKTERYDILYDHTIDISSQSNSTRNIYKTLPLKFNSVIRQDNYVVTNQLFFIFISDGSYHVLDNQIVDTRPVVSFNSRLFYTDS